MELGYLNGAGSSSGNCGKQTDGNLNGAGSSSRNSDATSRLAVGEESGDDTLGIYSMMNQVFDESSFMELEELFNSVVKNLPEDGSSTTKLVVNRRDTKTQVKQKKRKLPATASNASPETNQKKKKRILQTEIVCL